MSTNPSFQRYLSGEDPNHPPGDGYIASFELASAVNAALAVGRPLLLSGEPGTGKTSLAYSIALQLGLGEVLRFDTHTDSRWQDCLYSFDALRRLYDAQVHSSAAQDPARYVELRALGRAIQSPMQRLVLIDEVDKAPSDFPNGLLAAIDGDLRFEIRETGQAFRLSDGPGKRPIIVFTTNEERALPDAFLRRCIFCHIQPPDDPTLAKIVAKHFATVGENVSKDLLLSDEAQPSEAHPFVALAKKAIQKFSELRTKSGDQLEKKPATAELLDWISVLWQAGVAPDKVAVKGHYASALLKTKRDLELINAGTSPDASSIVAAS